MNRVAELGGVIMPPVPAFYHHQPTLERIIAQTVNCVFDQLDIALPKDLFLTLHWAGHSSWMIIR